MTEQQLKNLVANVFEIEADDVNETTSQETLSNWDSIHHLSLIASLEESLGVFFTDEETVQLTSYNQIKTLLKEKGITL